MCGILGFFDPAGLHELDALELARRMGELIRQRGPDDHGEWCDPVAGISLGHRRLSIIDLSAAGHQPMVSASGRYVITLNGEIYNYRQLRVELEREGYPFKGQSDTEVAVATIERHGFEQGVQRFVGMFALGLWDRENRTLSLCRDRLGEKPLYYGQVGGAFVFASDLAAMRAYPGWAPAIDRDALGLMLQHFYIPAPRTIYTGVSKLLPGCYLTIGASTRDVPAPVRYWSAVERATEASRSPASMDIGEAVESLDRLLRSTIRDKMIADVPLGAFLSGGIDSSTVAALMQAESIERVKTFSIGFAEDEFNEAHEAKRVAAHLGTEHTEFYVSPSEAQAVIPELPALYSEPFADSSQIPTYLVSRMARRDVTVALSGDGGDELFGGYTRYVLAENIWRKLTHLPAPLRGAVGDVIGLLPPAQTDRLLRALKPLIPERWRYRQLGNKLGKFAAMCRASDPAGVYKLLIRMWPRPSEVVIGARDIDMLAELPGGIPALPGFTEQMMLIDLLTYLPGDILTKVDRASMGVSLEVRVPFLDHRIVEHAWHLPPALKIRGGEGKWLLKQVLERYVPRTLVERPKMGFGVPIDKWLRDPMRDWAEELLAARRIGDEGYFDVDEVRMKWQQHLSGKADWQHLLWPVLMFQAWFDHHERSH